MKADKITKLFLTYVLTLTWFLCCGCQTNKAVKSNPTVSLSSEIPHNGVRQAIKDVYESDGWSLDSEEDQMLRFKKTSTGFGTTNFFKSLGWNLIPLGTEDLKLTRNTIRRDKITISHSDSATILTSTRIISEDYGNERPRTIENSETGYKLLHQISDLLSKKHSMNN